MRVGIDRPEECPQPPPMQPHLFPLPGGDWALWRWIALRGSGFPAARVLKLGLPGCAAVADKIISAEEDIREALDRALASVNASLDELRRKGEWDEKKDERNKLFNMRQSLLKGSVSQQSALSPEMATAAEAFKAANARADAAWEDLRQSFKSASAQMSAAVREEASTNRFKEAVIWQNRHALHSGIERLLRRAHAAEGRNSRDRQHEEMAANYLQRYCVKNDTIGFFGPVGWARLSSEANGIVIKPGPTLIDERNIYFEAWGIDFVAKSINKNNELRHYIPPRLVPSTHLEGTTLHVSFRGFVKFSRGQAAVIEACDGQKTAKQIAEAILRDSANDLRSEEGVYRFLDALESKGLISREIELPQQPYPERILREVLEQVDDESLRVPAIESLEKLERAREDVARASGDAERLDKAIENLETIFTGLTGLNPTRSEGKAYAGRTLIYEDCRRNIEVVISPEILNSISKPLSLLLTSARWLTFQVAATYRRAFKQLHAKLLQKANSKHIDFSNLWTVAQPLFFDQSKIPVATVLRSFQKHWTEILAIDEGERRVEYASEQLKASVAERFSAPSPGWIQAHYHCPDVMIAASGPEAIERGDYRIVMGELHVGVNTLGWPLFIEQHPSPADLFQAVTLDLPKSRLIPEIPASNQLVRSGRLTPSLVSNIDYHLQLAPLLTSTPKSRRIPIGDLIVERIGDDLVVRTRDGRLRFDIVEAMAEMFTLVVAGNFKILAPAKHSPRITIDRLVVSRESWDFLPADISFAYEKDRTDRFVAARRWARVQGMPRFVFVKSAIESKPFYVDFASPIYIDICAKAIRLAAENKAEEGRISISEMLPAHDELWLPDIDGEKYTSELRIVAVDLNNQ
jgi:lantibiotic biosynthesis dehydratase-like protein